MRKFMEAVDLLNKISNSPPPPKNRIPKGEGNGPKNGKFWLRGASLIKIAGTANEITNLSGQVVIIHPEIFGYTPDELMSYIKSKTHPLDAKKQYSAIQEYETYLAEPDRYDLSKTASLWKSSKLIFQKMIEDGWALVIYNPPESVHFAVKPDVMKRQIASAAEHLSLLQIGEIKVTLITDYDVGDKYPHFSKNKTITFPGSEYKNFTGAFGGAMDFANGGEAPIGNYLYIKIPDYYMEYIRTHRDAIYGAIRGKQASVNTPDGYRKRWAINFFTKPVATSGEESLVRVHSSISNDLHKQMHLTAPNKKGMRTLYSLKYIDIPKKEIEVLKDGKWVPFG